MLASEDTPNCYWNRETGEGITELGIRGPPFDHDEKKDKYFVFLSATQAFEPETNLSLTTQSDPGATMMTSPLLLSSQHLEECLEFWFMMEV